MPPSYVDPTKQALPDVSGQNNSQPTWVPYLSRFLLSRPSVTNWVQSCYTFHLAPPVRKLYPPILAFAHQNELSTPDGREVHWILQGLMQLGSAVDELQSLHRANMRRNPSLIWQKDIQAASEQYFWPVWEEHGDFEDGQEDSSKTLVPTFDKYPHISGHISASIGPSGIR